MFMLCVSAAVLLRKVKRNLDYVWKHKIYIQNKTTTASLSKMNWKPRPVCFENEAHQIYTRCTTAADRDDRTLRTDDLPFENRIFALKFSCVLTPLTKKLSEVQNYKFYL